MKKELPALHVRMLGGERITYGGQPVFRQRGGMSRVMKLLLILLYNSPAGITRNKLISDLYGREEVADGANNLRVACYRLKKMLMDGGLPEYEYITIQDGMYRFEASVKTEVDVHIFRSLISRAGKEKNQEKRIGLLREACLMYRGEFLKGLSGDEWVLVEGMRYKSMYSDALQEVCSYLKGQRDYEEILSLCAAACELYPFDEWQVVRIDCYIAMKRYKEAYKEYEDTAKLFFEELGVSPSERMLEQMKVLSGHLSRLPRDIREIKGSLKEKHTEGGPYYCSLPSFRDGYRLVRRITERSGQSVYLMLCSITDGNGCPMENQEKLDPMAGALYEALKQGLRRSDSFTRYSPTQYLALLIGTNQENCSLISERIRKGFCREHKHWSRNLECGVSSAADMENENSEMVFEG